MDPDESRMRTAAHSMVRFMTAGMALITCREPLNISINNNLRSTLMAALRVSLLHTHLLAMHGKQKNNSCETQINETKIYSGVTFRFKLFE